MKPIGIEGVFKKNGKIYTENLDYCKGIKVYNEKLVTYKDKEFRSWNPYRSKLAAAIMNGLRNINITSSSQILYLGAATGTTVSHISDIAKDGMIYAIDNSPITAKKLLKLCNKRKNIIPILSDAYHPNRYSTIVPKVDIIYQDISQRNQAEIFINNINRYLKINGKGVIMVKARSIDVSLEPKHTYKIVTEKINKNKLTIIDLIDISHYERDHTAIIISFK
jgi:fibrillarin-like pre-rRNA processing protein